MEERTLPSFTVLPLAGIPQSTVVGTAFATLLQVLVEDASGNPVGAGVNVGYSLFANIGGPLGVPKPGPYGTFAGAGGVGTNVAVATDSRGIATAPTLTANTVAGDFKAEVFVADDPDPSPMYFILTNLPGPPAGIVVQAPTTQPSLPQLATEGTAFGTPFQVAVQDAYENPVLAGIRVTFMAPISGVSGSFANGATMVTVATDAKGIATATPFTANGMVGDFLMTASAAGVAAPVSFNLETVSADAVINITGSNAITIVPAGPLGSVTCTIGSLTPSTLTGLTSLAFNASSDQDRMSVTLPSRGPLLPGPITYNSAADGYWPLSFDASAVSAANATFVTQPGRVMADGQPVVYRGKGVALRFPVTAGVNAAAAGFFPAPGYAFIKGYRGTMHPQPIYMSPPEHFVQVLYLDVLGRVGRLDEVDSWVAQLNAPGGSPATVAAAIEASPEARDRLVKTWYATYLGRQVQGGEEMGWVNLLQSGWSEEQVLGQILGSPEFYQRAQKWGTVDTPTQRYVRALYQVLLGRSASCMEVSGWDAALNTLGRSGVAQGFLQSPEFRTDQFEGYYSVLLHRSDDRPGLDGWVNCPLNMHDTRVGFEGSPEFFANG